MSSSSARRLLALAAVAVALAACGYRPLYGRTDAPLRVETQLAAVAVKPIPERVGQMFHTELTRRLNPAGTAVRPSHSLQITLSEAAQYLAVERDTFATRANLRLSATFELVRLADGQRVDRGGDVVVASYNLPSSDYATLIAQQDARRRAVGALADVIRNRVAVYFHGAGAAALAPVSPDSPPDSPVVRSAP